MSLSKCIILFLFVFSAICMCSCYNNKAKGESLYTNNSIVIDGVEEQNWSSATKYNAVNEICGNEWDGEEDLSIKWESVWNRDSIYLFIEVVDDKLVKNSDMMVPFWENDMVELFFTTKRKAVLPQNAHFVFCYDVDTIITYVKGGAQSINWIRKITDSGYNIEVAIPWVEIGINPMRRKSIFFNIEASDCDKVSNDTGIYFGRETDISWSPNSCNNSVRASNNFGTLLMKSR